MKKIIILLFSLIFIFSNFSFAYSSQESKVLNKIKIFMEKKIDMNPLKKDKYLEIIRKYKAKAINNENIFSLFNNIETFLINLDFHKQLTQKEKLALLNEVYNESDRYFQETEFTGTHKLSSNLKFDKIFVTMYSKNKIRCCQAGSNKDNILEYIDEATTRCIKDDRFGWELEDMEKEDMEVSFDFLYNKRSINKASINSTIKEGIHAIHINSWWKSAYFKSSVQITKNYDLKYTLKRLCKKAWAKEDCYKDNDTIISIYDTFAFKWNRNGDITDLYRYNILINQEQISNDVIYNRLLLAKNWFLNNINPDTGLLEYMYYPSKNKHESEDNNHIRQLASMWIMTELDTFFWSKDFKELAQATYDYYLEYYIDKGDYAFINIHKVTIANNAFVILGLLWAEQYDLNFNWELTQEEILEHLANGIIEMQREDGSYNTKFLMTTDSGADFYPGESMLALMKLYNHSWEEKYLESVEKAFLYYQDYWRNNKNTAFIPWHSQVDYLLYKATSDKKYAEFVFEMNDWIIDTNQTITSRYPDEIWWFPRGAPRISTSSYMEWINDAYLLAIAVDNKEHIKKYKESIETATRFILQLQFTEENSFYLEDNNKAIWGFKQSLTNNQLRNDNTQHASSALMKIYNNNIFE